MNGFGHKQSAENIGRRLTDEISTFSIKKPNDRSVHDPIEALSNRFDCLSKVSDCGDIAFYHGRDLRDDRLVELKVLRSHDDDSRGLELFQLEASAAAKLSHPHVLASSRLEEINFIHFSMLECRPGFDTLETMLDHQGWLEPGHAIGIVLQLAEALEYAHSLGVLHLRIHPENILIGPDSAVVLSDFGLEIECDLAWAHNERASRCPIHYISPEQVSGKKPDARSDLYSLGVVFYRMLTDRLPIDSEDADTLRQRQLTHSPLAPHLYCMDLPLALSAVVMRLLEKDPDERFQDAASLRLALGNSTPPANARWSDDSVSRPSNVECEEDQAPIDGDSLWISPSRESWEPPSITMIDPPIHEIPKLDVEKEPVEEPPSIAIIDPAVHETPKLELQKETVEERIEPGTPSEERLETSLYRNALLNSDLSSKFELSGQWRPLLLVLALAIAALSGLIVLARADRSEPPTRTLPEATGKDHSEPGSDRPAALPTSDASDETLVTGPQVAGQPPASASATTRAGTAIGSKRFNARTSSTSRRLRPLNRKWRRPTQYFPWYGGADGRYHRRGER